MYIIAIAAVLIEVLISSDLVLGVASDVPSVGGPNRDVMDAEVTKKECNHQFEGFGVHLGALAHINKTTDDVIQQVIYKLYDDLQLRLFRTSYEKEFSSSPNMYDISCRNAESCAWNKLHKELSNYPEAKVFASIWSPPMYMKTSLHRLNPEFEDDYLLYINNITSLIKQEFNQTIELVSLVNEPENFAAPWDHTNMLPCQLCGLVEKFNESLITACPENSWYSTTQVYMSDENCKRACQIVLTHAYALNLNPLSSNFLLASYDLTKYSPRLDGKPLWLTEVSSTYGNAENDQILEAINFATNIYHFVGTTCVSRYYFWSAFTNYPSGESLIWGNDSTDNRLQFPKTYFVYKHFTQAAAKNPNSKVWTCNPAYFDGFCLQFGNENSPTVFINNKDSSMKLKVGCSDLCCTTDNVDYSCEFGDTVPAYAVCSCDTLIR